MSTQTQYSYYGSGWVREITEELDGVAYDVGIESDKKNRGSAVNIDVVDQDNEQQLIVIQVRESEFHPRRYTRVRKQYLLAGRNENGNAFSHPIPTREVAHKRKPGDKIRHALAYIWDIAPCDVDDVRRNGDVAFIPVREIPASMTPVPSPQYLADSHRVTGELFEADGKLYARPGSSISHVKGQHAAVRTAEFARVAVGRRHQKYYFAQPTAD